jgi:hypothetical protein
MCLISWIYRHGSEQYLYMYLTGNRPAHLHVAALYLSILQYSISRRVEYMDV